jgi:hypothetical protein
MRTTPSYKDKLYNGLRRRPEEEKKKNAAKKKAKG